MYVYFGQGSSLLWTYMLRPFYSRPIALTQEGGVWLMMWKGTLPGREHYLLSADVQLTVKIFDLKLQLPDPSVESFYLPISQGQLQCDK